MQFFLQKQTEAGCGILAGICQPLITPFPIFSGILFSCINFFVSVCYRQISNTRLRMVLYIFMVSNSINTFYFIYSFNSLLRGNIGYIR